MSTSYPKTLTDEWKQALAAAGETPEEIHSALRHTLGNLTVTAYNGKLSNSLFERKQQILQGSHLELNRTVAASNQWGQDEILKRADELADRAIAIWPGPVAVVDVPGVPETDESVITQRDHEPNWYMLRISRFLKHFYEAPDNRLHYAEVKRLAVQEGYKPQGIAGFYRTPAKLRKDGDYRVLTDAGREMYLSNRHLLD